MATYESMILPDQCMFYIPKMFEKKLLLWFFFLIQFLEDGKIGELHFSKQCVKFDAGKVMLIKNTAKTFWFPKHVGDKHLLRTYPEHFSIFAGWGSTIFSRGRVGQSRQFLGLGQPFFLGPGPGGRASLLTGKSSPKNIKCVHLWGDLSFWFLKLFIGPESNHLGYACHSLTIWLFS